MKPEDKVKLDKVIADAREQHRAWLRMRAIAAKFKGAGMSSPGMKKNFSNAMRALNKQLATLAAEDQYLKDQMKSFVDEMFQKEADFTKQHLHMTNDNRISAVVLGRYILPHLNFKNIGPHAASYFKQAAQYRKEIVDNIAAASQLSTQIRNKANNSPQLEKEYLDHIAKCHEFAQLYNGTMIMGNNAKENTKLIYAYMAHRMHESIDSLSKNNQEFAGIQYKTTISDNGVEIYQADGSTVLSAGLDDNSYPTYTAHSPISKQSMRLTARTIVNSSDFSDHKYSISGGSPDEVVELLQQIQNEFNLLPSAKRTRDDMTIDIDDLLELSKNADPTKLAVIFTFLNKSRSPEEFDALIEAKLGQTMLADRAFRGKIEVAKAQINRQPGNDDPEAEEEASDINVRRITSSDVTNELTEDALDDEEPDDLEESIEDEQVSVRTTPQPSLVKDSQIERKTDFEALLTRWKKLDDNNHIDSYIASNEQIMAVEIQSCSLSEIQQLFILANNKYPNDDWLLNAIKKHGHPKQKELLSKLQEENIKEQYIEEKATQENASLIDKMSGLHQQLQGQRIILQSDDSNPMIENFDNQVAVDAVKLPAEYSEFITKYNTATNEADNTTLQALTKLDAKQAQEYMQQAADEAIGDYAASVKRAKEFDNSNIAALTKIFQTIKKKNPAFAKEMHDATKIFINKGNNNVLTAKDLIAINGKYNNLAANSFALENNGDLTAAKALWASCKDVGDGAAVRKAEAMVTKVLESSGFSEQQINKISAKPQLQEKDVKTLADNTQKPRRNSTGLDNTF